MEMFKGGSQEIGCRIAVSSAFFDGNAFWPVMVMAEGVER
jgi:hypothetical protein